MFAIDKPLRRLTGAAARVRRPGARPGARPGGPRNEAPEGYDLADDYGDYGLPQGSRRRWTEPGAYLASEREPDRTDVRYPSPPRRPGLPPLDADDRPGPDADVAEMRWNRPAWLDQRPPSMNADMDPDMDPGMRPGARPGMRFDMNDALPLNAPPRYPSLDGAPRYPREDSEAGRYQVPEEDSHSGETDFRSTSVRARFWASRTPSYQPDLPPAPAKRSTAELNDERAYIESYDTKRAPTAAPASLAHVSASLSGTQTGDYVPGAISEAERLRRETGRPAGPAPYFWEMAQRVKKTSPLAIAAFWLTSLLLVVAAALTFGYAGVSVYAASQLVYAPQVAPKGTPADAHLQYKDVAFTSRTDHLLLSGWFIPGVVGQGALSTNKTIIVVHGIRANRTDPGMGLLQLSDALAQHGFAVLAFDMRGSGDSSSAPTSLGYYEQRDVLGAVDFLQTGPMPYPNLGRPKVIGGWGVSMGASTLLLAAAQDPAIRAVVSDSAYADVLPILQREIPARSHLASGFTPGILEAAQVMYGIDFSAVKPSAVVAEIAPRPILFIHGADDTYVPPDNMTLLAQAAAQGHNAHVQTWLAPKAGHAQAFHVEGQAYVDRIVAFFSANLTPAS